MSILAHLRDHDARAAAFKLSEFIGELASFGERWVGADFGGIDSRDRTNHSIVTTHNSLHSLRDFTESCTLARGIHSEFEQVAFARLHALGDRNACSFRFGFIAIRLQLVQALDLRYAHSCVVHFENIDRRFFL